MCRSKVYKDMDAMLKRHPEFARYVAEQQRALALKEYDERIRALGAARAALAEEPVVALPTTMCAKTFCESQGWGQKDAMFLVADFERRFPRAQTAKTRQVRSRRIVSMLSRIASTILNV